MTVPIYLSTLMPLLGLLGLDCHGGHPAGGKVMPLLRPGLVPPPPHLLWTWQWGLHCWNCVKSRARLKSEKVDALPLDLDDLGVKGFSSPTWSHTEQGLG